ncbi:DUF4199 domain-containing protein [bacterium]|nr:DUF4199 domain-containing protein [bacterium]
MQKFKTELKWGLIFIVVILAWNFMERLVGLHSTLIDKHATYSNFFMIVAIAVYVFALIDKRDGDLGGKMTWKEGFLSGVIISVVVGVLTPLAQFIMAYVISPDYFTNAIRYGVEHGLTTQTEAEAYFNLNNYIITSTIFAPLMGIVTSAVVAFFIKTKAETAVTD